MATNVEIVWDGVFQPVSGTSCSSPIFASVIALINDARATKGQSPLGFLNPFLYANPQAFHDITTGEHVYVYCVTVTSCSRYMSAGNNPGCGTNGFDAAKGWDPVTGLGTPNFAALKAAAGL